jgi:predicted ribosomally synthesized peptide with SipW-like signal peptide
MKKIALASAAMGGAALLAFGASGTFASFQDQQQVTASAGAGSIVLDLQKATGSAAAVVSNLTPGSTTPTQYAYWVQNDGTLPGTITAAVTVVDNENGCVGPEDNGLDSTCAGANMGEFSSFAQVAGFITHANSQENCKVTTTGRTQVVGPVSLIAAASSARLLSQTVPAGAGACVVIDLTLPDNPNINLAQGDSADLTATFTLAQGTATRAPIKIDGEVDPMPTPIGPIEFSKPGGRGPAN